MPVSYESIVSALTSLSRSQLQAIKSRCQLLIQTPGGPVSIEDEDWLLNGILSELRRRGEYVPIRFRADRGNSFGSFNTKSEEVRRLLECAAPGLNIIEKRALGEIAAKALADFLPYIKIHPTFQNMMLKVNLVPRAIDEAYPGYMESELLGLTVRKKDVG